jgi:hypothetical protein
MLLLIFQIDFVNSALFKIYNNKITQESEKST